VRVYADLFRYRDLFLTVFRRDFQVRYRGSILGLAWSLLYPATLVGVYTLVFSFLWRVVEVDRYPLFVLSGLVTWVFFQSSLQLATTSLVAHASLVKQVPFPRQLLTLSVVATNLVTFLVMLAIVVAVNLALVPATRSTFWVVFLLVPVLVALVSGLAIAVACANVLFRDVEHLLGAAFLPWFFVTPVLYTFEMLPGSRLLADVVHYANFVTPITQAIRDPLFFGRLPTLGDAIYACVAAAVALAVGAYAFMRVDDRLAAEL
jgi:ABC-type polysaccharide/polyol phosphate export permease